MWSTNDQLMQPSALTKAIPSEPSNAFEVMTHNCQKVLILMLSELCVFDLLQPIHLSDVCVVELLDLQSTATEQVELLTQFKPQINRHHVAASTWLLHCPVNGQ